jgi:hypothetical protein
VNIVVLETPNGDIRVEGARIMSITRGEWHPIQQQGSEIGMEVGTSLYYPAMDVVVCWEPNGRVSWDGSSGEARPAPTQRIFLPNGVALDPASLEGMRLQFGFDRSEMGVYTRIRNASKVIGNPAYWVAYSCFIGNKKITTGTDNGDPMTEVVMKKADKRVIRGGWVFATPGSSTPPSSNGKNPHWMTLSATRFAIIGSPYGALFGKGRELYYECGLEEDVAQLAAIREEFGFASNEGTCAYIKVYDDIHNFLIQVEPE